MEDRVRKVPLGLLSKEHTARDKHRHHAREREKLTVRKHRRETENRPERDRRPAQAVVREARVPHEEQRVARDQRSHGDLAKTTAEPDAHKHARHTLQRLVGAAHVVVDHVADAPEERAEVQHHGHWTDQRERNTDPRRARVVKGPQRDGEWHEHGQPVEQLRAMQRENIVGQVAHSTHPTRRLGNTAGEVYAAPNHTRVCDASPSTARTLPTTRPPKPAKRGALGSTGCQASPTAAHAKNPGPATRRLAPASAASPGCPKDGDAGTGGQPRPLP